MSYYQQIYDRLRKAGFTEAGALGVLGNWECESNCEPGRLEGDYNSFRTVSKQYVWDVTNGRIGRQQFGSDQKGFGLAQWTYVNYPYNTKGRKFDLYDYWKKSGLALDSVEMQVNFALKEFKESFASDLAILKRITDVEEACRVVCARFENPAVHNITDRHKAALRIKDMIDLNSTGTAEPVEYNTVKFGLTLRTVDKNCSGWNELFLLQSLLRMHGYDLSVTGIWGDETGAAVEDFQKRKGLQADRVVGKNTWNALLERG